MYRNAEVQFEGGARGAPSLSVESPVEPAFEIHALSDPGTERGVNEDHCGAWVDNVTSGLVVVADGVSGYEGGDTASRTAVSTLLRCYQEQAADISIAKRLYRAVQRANIAVFDLATVVPELRGMATTVTATVIAGDELSTVHVGDSRLYLIRAGNIEQLTKDHTVVGERARLRLLSKERARTHPDRSTLTRSLGRELIASVDRITTRVNQGDALVACSDGLYNVLDDEHIRDIVGERSAPDACRALIESANARGTPDNVTAAVIRIVRGASAPAQRPSMFAAALRRLTGR
jgi:protein phosphatase